MRRKYYKIILSKWNKKILKRCIRLFIYFVFLGECNDDNDEIQKDHSELTNLELIDIMNNFMFKLFCFYVVFLNLFLLVILPYVIKKPLVITRDTFNSTFIITKDA